MELVDKNKLYECSPYIRAKCFTQLMLCVLNNDLETASSYIFEINDKNSEGWTALHIACRNSKTFSSEEMVYFLLRNGADSNAKANYGWTPLHYASKYSNSDSSLATVEALLRNGADSNAKDDYDDVTPLHVASKNSAEGSTSSLTTVDLLLKNGADPNAKDYDDETPLHIASRDSNYTSSLETIALLLKNGADPNMKAKYNYTPLRFALLSSISPIATVKLFLRYGATPINEETQILKLEIDIESFVEANEKLRQHILMLEDETD